jgi:glycosyltransferase involved in cell wall biosynthesis
MHPRIACALVTYNRKAVLKRAVAALLGQTVPVACVLIVDNASEDGTEEMLQRNGFLDVQTIVYRRLKCNVGCSAGFAEALSLLLESGYEWLWLLDDDAVAAPTALEVLVTEAKDPNTAYCSVAVGQGSTNEALCWPVTLVDAADIPHVVFHHKDLPAVCETTLAPFLGLLLHRSLVEKIGLPDRGFFISGDDAEYSCRMRRHGARIMLVKASRVEHPLPRRRVVSIFGTMVQILEQAPWRRYYEVRNRLAIAKRYQGRRLWTEAVPGTFVRWVVTLVYQPERLVQSKAFALGLWHGLRGVTGMRWLPGARTILPDSALHKCY